MTAVLANGSGYIDNIEWGDIKIKAEELGLDQGLKSLLHT